MFDDRYCNDETGRKAIDPNVLIKIVLFGYSRGLISSRSLERACRENITFMALSCGQKPDHSTIAAFVSSLDKEIEPLLTNVLLICDEEDLLGGTHFSLDGLKLSSNAAKEWTGLPCGVISRSTSNGCFTVWFTILKRSSIMEQVIT